jgi:hypothetical protein
MSALDSTLQSLLTTPPYRAELSDDWSIDLAKPTSSATRRFLVLGSNMAAGLGWPAYGEAHPLLNSLKVDHIRIEPLRESHVSILGSGYELGGRINDFVVVECHYSTDWFDIGDALRKSIRMKQDYLRIGAESHWASDGEPTGESIVVPSTVHEILFRVKFSEAGWTAIEPTLNGMLNKVNSAPWKGYAAETLQFNGPAPEQEPRQENGTPFYVWDVTYSFTFRPDGFRNFYRAYTNAWDTIIETPFSTGDFSTLGLGS